MKENYFRNLMSNDSIEKDNKKRVMTFIISDESTNRYGHKVKVDGWNLKSYKLNPVVLVNHNSDRPVANSTRVWVDKDSKKLMATIQFYPEGISTDSDLMFNLYNNNFLKAVSPGYLVDYSTAEYIEHPKKGDARVVFNSQELIEISLATVPANAGALKQQSYIQNALKLGVITEDLLDKTKILPYSEAEMVVSGTVISSKSVENSEQIYDTNNTDPFKDFFDEYDKSKKQESNIPEFDVYLDSIFDEKKDDDFDIWLSTNI